MILFTSSRNKPAMHRLRALILGGSLLIGLSSSPVAASSANPEYASQIYGMSFGAVLFNTSGTRTTTPSCQGPGLGQRFALDGSTVAGQAQIAVFLNAYNAHKRMTVIGTGSCTIQADTETVLYFLVED